MGPRLERTGGAPGPAPLRGSARPGRRAAARLVIATALLSLGAVACSSGTGTDAARRDGFDSARPVVVAAPSVPPPDTADLRDVPSAGTVVAEPGPFDDVLRWEGLTLQTGLDPTVTGTLASTVDVAPLLALEVRVSFYDAAGKYLGEGTFLEEGTGEEAEGETDIHSGEPVTSSVVTVRPDADLGGDAVSARLSVVQFVTE